MNEKWIMTLVTFSKTKTYKKAQCNATKGNICHANAMNSKTLSTRENSVHFQMRIQVVFVLKSTSITLTFPVVWKNFEIQTIFFLPAHKESPTVILYRIVAIHNNTICRTRFTFDAFAFFSFTCIFHLLIKYGISLNMMLSWRFSPAVTTLSWNFPVFAQSTKLVQFFCFVHWARHQYSNPIRRDKKLIMLKYFFIVPKRRLTWNNFRLSIAGCFSSFQFSILKAMVMRRFSRVLKKVAKVCSSLNSIQYVFINYDFIFHFDGAIMHSSFAARDAYSVCEIKQQQAWRQKQAWSLENGRNQKWYTKNGRYRASERASAEEMEAIYLHKIMIARGAIVRRFRNARAFYMS